MKRKTVFTPVVRASKRTKTESLVGGNYTRAPSKVELKRKVDDTITAGLIPTTGGIFSFPVPNQGSADDERDGRSIQVKAFSIRFLFQPNFQLANNINQHCGVRVIVFKWTVGNATFPSVNDVLAVSGNPGILAPYEISNASIMKILVDKTYTFNQESLSATGGTPGINQQPVKYITIEKAYTMNQTFYSTTANQTDNMLCVLILPDNVGVNAWATGATTYIDN